MTTVSPQIRTPQDELGAIVAAYSDVTDKLKRSHERLADEVGRLRRELAEKNRELARQERLAALGEMAAGVAHEIRNPLGGIQLLASLLERDLHDRPDARELTRKISNGVNTLDGIVNDILAFAGPIETRMRPVRLRSILAETEELVAPQARALDAHVDVDDQGATAMVLADPPRLQRGLLNLLFNALDAAGHGGRVTLSVNVPDEPDGMVEITVADDGPGIDPGVLPRMFDPFVTTKDSGTGLGLAITHRIVQAHGGTIRAANGANGGAEVTLALPRAGADRTSTKTQGESGNGAHRRCG